MHQPGLRIDLLGDGRELSCADYLPVTKDSGGSGAQFLCSYSSMGDELWVRARPPQHLNSGKSIFLSESGIENQYKDALILLVRSNCVDEAQFLCSYSSVGDELWVPSQPREISW